MPDDQYTSGVPPIEQLDRPDWTSTLVGVIPVLRAASQGREVTDLGRRLLGLLADEIEGEVQTNKAVASLLRGARQPQPGPGLRGLLLSAAAAPGEKQTGTGIEAVSVLLRRLSEPGQEVSSKDAQTALSLLEHTASLTFGTVPSPSEITESEERSPQTHLSAGEVERFATGINDDKSLRSHIEVCERCSDAVERYRRAYEATPLEQYPDHD